MCELDAKEARFQIDELDVHAMSMDERHALRKLCSSKNARRVSRAKTWAVVETWVITAAEDTKLYELLSLVVRRRAAGEPPCLT